MEEDSGGVVVPLFPESKKICCDCKHAALHSSGVYCVAFNEFIMNESVADECELFEDIDG